MDGVAQGAIAAETAHTHSVCWRRHQGDNDNVARRAAHAMSLTQMGEMSAARQALEGAAVAPGTLSTLRALTDPEKRPPLPRTPLSREVAEAQPSEAFQLDSIEFLTCLRKDDIGPLVQNEGASDLLCTVASLLAVGQVPDSILQALRLGRMTALSKPDGRVRGIVVGDIFRRLVARTIAKQVAEKVEAATAPFQHTLSTKAGCEFVAHIFQTLTDLDPETTIMSVDGVGAGTQCLKASRWSEWVQHDPTGKY